MDSSNLLTLLGLVVAVIAIIPKTLKLDFSLRISKIDWCVIIGIIVVVHYIIYFPILSKFGFFIDLGPWRYGFNADSTIYIIFLFLVSYVFFRTRNAKVNNYNINGFCELFERLFLEEKFGELSLLVEKHILDVINIKSTICLRSKLAKKLRPLSQIEMFILKEQGKKNNLLKNKFPVFMISLANIVEPDMEQKGVAGSIIRRILCSDKFVEYLALSKPYLCLSIIGREFEFRSDFVELYIASLLENKRSVYYYELEHTQNTFNSRYCLSKENKLLYFLFKDVSVSEGLGIYKPVGDKVCELIDYDYKMVQRYNDSLRAYYEKEQFRCPVNASLKFFEIMITESMHQGIRWHMWLYYFPVFTEKIISKMEQCENVDLYTEWPTPFHYLIYRIISIIIDWLEEYEHVEDKTNLHMENENLCHDNGSIPKSAIMALGDIVYKVVKCDNVTDRFKVYLVDKIMRFIRDYKNKDIYQPLVRVLMKSILFRGVYNNSEPEYLTKLSSIYSQIDHLLLYELREFETLLEDSMQGM